MLPSEVARLFAYCCFYDSRLETHEGKILAWSEALSHEITFDWAKGFVAKHYGASKYSIAPSDFNLQFDYERKQDQIKQKSLLLDREFLEARKNALPKERLGEMVAYAKSLLQKGNDDEPKSS